MTPMPRTPAERLGDPIRITISGFVYPGNGTGPLRRTGGPVTTAKSNAETLKALIAQLKAFLKFNDTTLPTQVLISVFSFQFSAFPQ
jgi:hypothetical protein